MSYVTFRWPSRSSSPFSWQTLILFLWTVRGSVKTLIGFCLFLPLNFIGTSNISWRFLKAKGNRFLFEKNLVNGWCDLTYSCGCLTKKSCLVDTELALQKVATCGYWTCNHYLNITCPHIISVGTECLHAVFFSWIWRVCKLILHLMFRNKLGKIGDSWSMYIQKAWLWMMSMLSLDQLILTRDPWKE